MGGKQKSTLWLRWVAANTLGEIFGLGGTFAVGALAISRLGDQPGVLFVVISFLVAVFSGAIEATIVGFAQWWAIHPWFQTITRRAWWTATLIGALIAYVLGYLPSTIMHLGEQAAQAQPAAASQGAEPAQWVILLLAAGLGVVAGAMLSFAQWLVLRKRVKGAGWWIPANMLAWMVGMPLIFWGIDAAQKGQPVWQGSIDFGGRALSGRGSCRRHPRVISGETGKSKMNTSKFPSTNYEELAPVYDRRYTASPLSGVGASLERLVKTIKARRVLEAGCGTGHWLELLLPFVSDIYGLDPSAGMLAQAQSREKDLLLVRGRATELPFVYQVFDLVFCVNAIHHFGDPRAFIIDARRLLAPGGALAVIGLDPHVSHASWYVYHYFEGTYQTDIKRFPTRENLQIWMEEAGFERLEWQIAEQIKLSWHGRDVLDDPFLKKESTSQLSLLSDDAYATGLSRIAADLAAAESEGRVLEFPADLELQMITGYLGKVDHG